MRVLLAGGSGFVGRALRRQWACAGVPVVRLVRRTPRAADEVEWAPGRGRIDRRGLDGCDVLVNLAGENIAAGRWTRARKARLRASRVDTTRLLAETVAAGPWRPRVWINASAVGYYGDGGETGLTEQSPRGCGFLASLCGEWEAATLPAAAVGVRVVRLRLGAVLAAGGGMLARLRPLYRLGLGGPIGDGLGWLSWIALEDLCRVVDFAATTPRLDGAVNAVSPEPVRNRDFARALGRACGRPAVLPVPGWAVRLLLGGLGRELLLASQRVRPAVLQSRGFRFLRTDLGATLGGAGVKT